MHFLLLQYNRRIIATLGRECRDWAPGDTDEAVEALISENSQDGDAVVFTDGSVKRGEKSGWAFTVRCRGETVGEGSGAVEVTTSSMVMKIKAVTESSEKPVAQKIHQGCHHHRLSEHLVEN